jgi:hypothetical protein
MPRHQATNFNKALGRAKEEATKKLTKNQISKKQKPDLTDSKTKSNGKIGTVLPCIVSDIDGVVVKGKEVIGNSSQIVRRVLQPVNGANLPFSFLTNGGGCTES